PENVGRVVAYQPWLNGERGAEERHKLRCRHPRKRVTQYSGKVRLLGGGDYWVPAFAGMTTGVVALARGPRRRTATKSSPCESRIRSWACRASGRRGRLRRARSGWCKA